SPKAHAPSGFSTTGRPCCRSSSRFSRMSSSACWVSSAHPSPWNRLMPRQLSPRGRCSVGKVTGFLEATRETPTRRPVEERVNDYQEVYQDFPEQKLRTQAAR